MIRCVLAGPSIAGLDRSESICGFAPDKHQPIIGAVHSSAYSDKGQTLKPSQLGTFVTEFLDYIDGPAFRFQIGFRNVLTHYTGAEQLYTGDKQQDT